MSLESLVLAILFLVLPLIELFREARKKGQKERPDRARQVPVRRPPPRMQPPVLPTEPQWERIPSNAAPIALPTDIPKPPVIAVPEAANVRQTLSDRIAARRRLATQTLALKDLQDAATERKIRTRGEAVADLRSPGGVRRAMVVMTILGPCRAVDPY